MIKHVRLQNCQSLKDVTYSFSADKLNVIIAENDTGKSVLYKILKLAGKPDYYSRAERMDLIRRGAQYAQVMFQFSDDSFGVMQIFDDKVVYSWVENLKDGVSWCLEPPIEFLDRLGLLVSPSESFIANIIDTDQGLLLVNPRLASNYELIKLIATCEDLDLIRERIEPLIQEYRSILLREKDNLGFLNRQLDSVSYVDVDRLNRKYNVSKVSLGVAEILCTLYELVEKFPSFKDSINFNDSLVLTETLEVLEKAVSLKFPLVPDKVSEVPLTVLETIDAVKNRVSSFKYYKEEVPITLANSLLTLTQIAERIGRLKIPRELKGAELIEPLDVLERLSMRVKQIPDYHKYDVAIYDLEKSFNSGGRIVDCPVYGKVVFDGKECVADSK